MIGPDATARSELRVSHRPLIALLFGMGVVFALSGDGASDPHTASALFDLSLLCYALAPVALVVSRWKPALGRWSVILGLMVIVVGASVWLDVPGILTLLFVPSALAAVVISLPAGAIVGVMGSFLTAVAARWVRVAVDADTVGIGLIAIWASLAVMYALHRCIDQLAAWSWEHFTQAREALDEARDRQLELNQALSGLEHANRQLALNNERTANLRLVAEEARRTKEAFVAKVSHEFRTPLNMIIGLTDLLVENPEVYGDKLQPELLEDLQIVHRNCEHLSGMVDDVLALSQAEAGRLALRREWLDMVGIIEESVEVVRPLLDKKGLNVRVSLSEDVPPVFCDRTRIRQVVLNLISNAARFTEEGGITIQVDTGVNRILVSVADTGPGIPEEDVESIFEPFCQGSTDLWRDRGGSGLGLSISKQFVELHGGRIWLQSEVGVGTTFSFSLPLSVDSVHLSGPDRWMSEEWTWIEGRSTGALPDTHYRPRVVVYDDTGELFPGLARYPDECEVVRVGSPEDAASELQRSPAHAVILNTTSPLGILPRIEEVLPGLPDTPVFGCSVPPQLERAREAGAADYLIKPITRTKLVEAIEGIGATVGRVLVVDDDADTLRLVQRMLDASYDGIEVSTALSGAEALAILRSNPQDLVLLDIVMPAMDGWQTLDEKREDETIRDVPVILVSAQDLAERPATSPVLSAAISGGLSIDKLLSCSLALSSLLLHSDRSPDPERVAAPDVSRA